MLLRVRWIPHSWLGHDTTAFKCPGFYARHDLHNGRLLNWLVCWILLAQLRVKERGELAHQANLARLGICSSVVLGLLPLGIASHAKCGLCSSAGPA